MLVNPCKSSLAAVGFSLYIFLFFFYVYPGSLSSGSNGNVACSEDVQCQEESSQGSWRCAGAQGQAAGVDAGTLIVSNKLSNMDFTAADRQVWICWGGAKDCFEAAAKDCRLAVAKMVASSSGAKRCPVGSAPTVV